MQQQRKELMGKVALGATGVVLTAGALATAAALMNKRNRTTLKKGVTTAAKKINQAGRIFDEGRNVYQAVAHQVGSMGSKKRGRPSKTASRK